MSLFQEIYKVLIARTYKDSQKVKLATEAMEIAKQQALIKMFLPSVEKTGGILTPQFSNLETITLAIAHDNLEIWNRPAKALFIVDFDGNTANTRIRFDEIASAMYPIRVGHIKTDFEKIYLTNTAQAGKNLQFVVGYSNFADYQMIEQVEPPSLPEILVELTRTFGTTPGIASVDMPSLDTECSFAIPNGTNKLTLEIGGGGQPFRVAWVSGKVAAPTLPYMIIAANEKYRLKNVYLTDKTIYFACDVASQIMVIETVT